MLRYVGRYAGGDGSAVLRYVSPLRVITLRYITLRSDRPDYSVMHSPGSYVWDVTVMVGFITRAPT